MKEESFWNELHKRVGRCGHCGSRKCPDRKSWSVLPTTIKTDVIIAAVKAAR